MPHARKRARSRRLRVKPERIDAAVAAFESDQLPSYKEQAGFRGFTMLANRESGKMLGISYWEDEEGVRASEGLGRAAGEQAAETGEGEVEGPDEWVVVLDEDV
ncbi:MAG: antibiotic biosynthesis monooxygenase [Vicinamibacteria bacterium]|jgi:heme-degrading monooxygenase HmoA